MTKYVSGDIKCASINDVDNLICGDDINGNIYAYNSTIVILGDVKGTISLGTNNNFYVIESEINKKQVKELKDKIKKTTLENVSIFKI